MVSTITIRTPRATERVRSKWRIGKDYEGSGHGLILRYYIQAFDWND
jgi:hypothetical protein